MHECGTVSGCLDVLATSLWQGARNKGQLEQPRTLDRKRNMHTSRQRVVHV